MVANLAAKNDAPVEIVISIQPLRFPPGCDYLDWNDFNTDRSQLQPSAPAAAPPAVLDMTTLIDGLTAAIIAAAPRAAVVAPPPPLPLPIPAAAYLFDPRTLAPDVLVAYTNFRDHRLITSTSVAGTFGNGVRHSQDGERLFLRDGTLFLLDQDIDEKGFLRDPVKCHNESPVGLRAWYSMLVRHAFDHGIYVHPFYLFQKNHGELRGFTAGPDPTDDLPQRMEIPLTHMSLPLFKFLSKDKMFPTNSPVPDILRSIVDGDGYKALKTIIFSSHPIFQEQPGTLLTAYPRQLDLTLVQYHSQFMDYLQLRAFITNYDSSLDSSTEMDAFIFNTKYNIFLTRVTRDERSSPAKAYKYTSGQILETLTSFLTMADSPAMETSSPSRPPPSSSSSTTNRGYQRPSSRRVQALTVEDASSDAVVRDETLDEIIQDLHTLEIPDDFESFRVHTLYTRALYAMQAAPSRDPTSPCIVCAGTHRFNSCPILKNTEFLRGHYIRFCQQARRDATLRASAFPGTNGEIPTPRARVNAILALPAATDYDSDTEQDFHQAHR